MNRTQTHAMKTPSKRMMMAVKARVRRRVAYAAVTPYLCLSISTLYEQPNSFRNKKPHNNVVSVFLLRSIFELNN